MNLGGEDKKTHFHSKYANQFTLSPDNKWLAFGELYHVYLVPFADHGQPFELSGDLKTMPITKVSKDAGINLQWSGDGEKVHWTLGSNYYTVELKNCFTFLEGSPDSIGEIKRDVIDIGLTLKTDKPDGKLRNNFV